MPPVKRPVLGHQTIGAGWRKPAHCRHGARCQGKAIGDLFVPVGIVAAAAGVLIEEPTGDAGPVDLAGAVVFQLVQTAAPAAIAQRFPFRRRQLVELLGQPKRFTIRIKWLRLGWQHGNRFLNIGIPDRARHGVTAPAGQGKPQQLQARP